MAATEDADWQTQITSFAAGKKIVGVLDCVSGSLVGDLVPLLADGATIVAYGSLSGDTQLGIAGPELIDHQFVIRGVTFSRWFFELSQDEQINDIQSAIKLADELPSLFKVSSVHSLADFQRRSRPSKRRTVTGSSSSSHSARHSELAGQQGLASIRTNPRAGPKANCPSHGEQIERGEAL